MQEMGNVYTQLGLLDEAERLFREALDIRQDLPTASRIDIAETVAGLANVSYLSGDYERSIEFYREAIERAESAEGPVDALWLATTIRTWAAFTTRCREMRRPCRYCNRPVRCSSHPAMTKAANTDAY